MDNTTAQTMLGRYRLLRKIGAGGMGEVWLAEDPMLRRQVAVKTLPRHDQDDQEYLLRFEREARAAAALHHPHILPVHDYGQQRMPSGETITYIVMSYVAGGSVGERLAQYTHKHMLLPPIEAFAYLSQVAEAIDYAHQQGIVHRDIKPANMLLREDNWLLLADFGLARIASDTDHLTQAGVGFGTPKYMAPEQAQGRAVASSDIYSLAVVAYEFFAGRVPFAGDTPYATTILHMVSPPPSPRQFNPALSPAFEDVLLRALAKTPEQRPPTAQVLVNALRQAMPLSQPLAPQSTAMGTTQLQPGMQLTHTPSTPFTFPATQPVTPGAPRPSQLSRRTILIASAAAAVILGGAGLTYALTHSGTNPGPSPNPTKTVDPNAPAITISSAFSQSVSQLAWSPGHNRLAATDALHGGIDGGHVLLWDIQPGQTAAPAPAAQLLYKFMSTIGIGTVGIAWSADGTMLAMGPDTSHQIQVYKSDLSGLAPGFTPIVAHNSNETAGLTWAPAPYLFVTEDISGDAQHVLLRTFNPKQPQQKLSEPRIDLPTSFTFALDQRVPILASADGTKLLVGIPVGVDGKPGGAQIGSVSITDTQVKWQPQALLPTQHDVTALAWSPDTHYAAALNSQNELNAWDLTRQQALSLDQAQLRGAPAALAWSPSAHNPLLAVAGASGNILLWNVGTSTKPARVLPGLANRVTAVAWSYDGQWLAASYDDAAASILIWRITATHE